jgi:uncharacterized membrane protein
MAAAGLLGLAAISASWLLHLNTNWEDALTLTAVLFACLVLALRPGVASMAALERFGGCSGCSPFSRVSGGKAAYSERSNNGRAYPDTGGAGMGHHLIGDSLA